ncbi:hypothetical protein ACFXAP_003699 [Vibrio cholerae]
MNKNYSFFVIILITIAIGLMGPYLFIFNGGLSNNSSDWGSFGSYFGGVLSPILSFFTIIVLIITSDDQKRLLSRQLKSQSEEIEMLKNQSKINQIFDTVTKLRETILELTYKKYPVQHLFLGYKILYPEYRFEYDPDLKILHSYDKNGMAGSVFFDIDMFTVINGVRNEFDINTVKRVFIDGQTRLFQSDIMSYVSQVDYFISLLSDLHNLGFDKLSIKYHLSLVFERYNLLYEFGYVNDENYKQLNVFQSMPLKKISFSYSVHDILEGVMNELNSGLMKFDKIQDINEFSFGDDLIVFKSGGVCLRVKLRDSVYQKSNGVWHKEV